VVPEPQTPVLHSQRVGLSGVWEVVLLVSQDHPIEVYDERVQMVKVPLELFVWEASQVE